MVSWRDLDVWMKNFCIEEGKEKNLSAKEETKRKEKGKHQSDGRQRHEMRFTQKNTLINREEYDGKESHTYH